MQQGILGEHHSNGQGNDEEVLEMVHTGKQPATHDSHLGTERQRAEPE